MQGRLSLQGERIQFDRSGRTLLIADDERVSIVRSDGQSSYVARSRVRALAGFDDQIWLVEDDVLYRHDLDGRLLGEHLELPEAIDAPWISAPCGPAGVVWPAHPAFGIVDDLGALATHAHRDADLIVPLTARRALAIIGTKIYLPSGLVASLPPGTRVLAGMVLGDGKKAVLAITHGGDRRLVTLTLGSDQIGPYCAMPSDLVRVATRRAIAAMRLEPNQIGFVDLRFGRDLGSFVVDKPIDDFAIEPDGQRVAVQSGRDLEVLELAELLLETRAVRARGTLPPASRFERESASAQPADSMFATTVTSARPTDSMFAPAVGSPSHADSIFATDLTAPPPPDSSPTSEMPVSALSEPLAPLEPISAPQRLDTLAPGSEPLLGLAPRQLGPRLSREAALASLDLERDLVLARARAGIALAWDTRRLGYANESRNPFELEVAALLGSGRGHATSLVTEAERLLTAATAARARDREQHFDASPLAEIARDFGLDALELDILIAIAAPTLWGETARLYGVLGNDPGRAIVDEMLVSQLLAATTRYEVAAALGPDGALRRHAIVVATGDRPRPFTTLAINPIVAARLRCESVPLPDAVRVQEASTNLDELYVPIEPIGRLLRELARPQSKSVRLAVRGRRASGRRSVLAGIAARANRALGLIDLGALSSPGAPADLRRWLRMASLCGLIPCVVGAPTTEAAARPLVETIAMHAGPVFAVLGLDDASPFPPGHFELVLPPLSAGDRLDHWRRALGLHGLRVADPEQLSSRYRLAPGLVETAVAHVARSAERPTDDVTAELVTAIRQGRDERLARHATRITRLPRWSDVVLPPDVLDSLRELIGRVQHGRRVYEEWGFDAVMTTGRGVTALFDGRPGTGKTMVAGVVARELGLDLYRVDLSRLVSKWIGETEKNLAEIFDAVDDGQAIILFDEADSLFGKRTEVKSSNDRYANLEVNYLLQRIDSFEGIAILTTNFGSAIDPAFRRRVSLRLSFPFPDEDAREQLWRVHLPRQLPIDGELDLAALARRFQLAGGYIRNACLRAAFLAAQEETTLAQRHLERAVQLEYQQVGKISTSGPVD